MKSLPRWIAEIYAEHPQSTHALSNQTERPADSAPGLLRVRLLKTWVSKSCSPVSKSWA